MGQAEVVVQVVQGQLLAYPHHTFAQGRHPPANGGHMLANSEVDALEEGRIDLPAVCGQHLVDPRQGAEPHARTHCH